MSYSISKRDNNLVEVECGSDFRVLFPEFNGQFRITFKADAPAFLRKVKQGKHFPGHFKDQSRIVKRKAFGDGCFGEAVFPDFFDIHNIYMVCESDTRNLLKCNRDQQCPFQYTMSENIFRFILNLLSNRSKSIQDVAIRICKADIG